MRQVPCYLRPNASPASRMARSCSCTLILLFLASSKVIPVEFSNQGRHSGCLLFTATRYRPPSNCGGEYFLAQECSGI